KSYRFEHANLDAASRQTPNDYFKQAINGVFYNEPQSVLWRQHILPLCITFE
ncbi:unnamed protein product, partial [Ceratitis capitata]